MPILGVRDTWHFGYDMNLYLSEVRTVKLGWA